MRVQLQSDNQFGLDGPQAGDVGRAWGFVVDSDEDTYFWVTFPGHQTLFSISAKLLAVPDTSGSETYWKWDEGMLDA